VILIYSDHMPEPLYAQADPVLCRHCEKRVERIEDFGWVHDPSDHLVLPDQAPNTARCRFMNTRRCPESGCVGKPCARFESDDETRWRPADANL